MCFCNPLEDKIDWNICTRRQSIYRLAIKSLSLWLHWSWLLPQMVYQGWVSKICIPFILFQSNVFIIILLFLGSRGCVLWAWSTGDFWSGDGHGTAIQTQAQNLYIFYFPHVVIITLPNSMPNFKCINLSDW